MIRFVAAAALALGLTTGGAFAATCNAAVPSIANVAVKNVTTSGGLNHYEIVGTVVNNGSAGQASNVLQSVDIFLAQQKLDTRSIPPLAAGKSFQFTYTYDRSSGAGQGTTKLTFALDPAPAGPQECGSAIETVTF